MELIPKFNNISSYGQKILILMYPVYQYFLSLVPYYVTCNKSLPIQNIISHAIFFLTLIYNPPGLDFVYNVR